MKTLNLLFNRYRPTSQIYHVFSAEPLGKRRKRRLRGKNKRK